MTAVTDGVLLDVCSIDEVVADEHVEHREHQGRVRAGQWLDESIR